MINYLIECDGGKFGQNCSSFCGQCREQEKCHYISGTCPNGCDSGYQGRHCTLGDEHFRRGFSNRNYFAVLQSFVRFQHTSIYITDNKIKLSEFKTKNAKLM